MTALTGTERESVAIGAAIAAGCRPCTQYHVRAALKAGLSEEEVRLAVKDAEVLRVEAATGIADYAHSLLGGAEKDGRGLCNPAEPLQALVQVGAATGANAGYLLDALLPQARSLGLSNAALEEAVEMASTVKTVAAEFFRKDAERALGRQGEVAAAPEAGGCAPMPQAVARESVESAEAGPGTCC